MPRNENETTNNEQIPNLVQELINNWRLYPSRRVYTIGNVQLTSTEVTVLAMFTSGMTYKRIALELERSISTIDKHMTSIHRKTRILSACGLAHFAICHGLIEAGEFVP